MAEQPKYTNRLIHETSPYLRQHAHNPVDWYPWGEEAIQKARDSDKPIFLSIGYSACHWCHVMEHESFEDPEIGQYLNEHFISIKVDREERAEIDQIYMSAVVAFTQGRGGWPMSVFLKPDLKPFAGGTYFPPTSRYGMISFGELLKRIMDAWNTRRQDIDEVAQNVTDHIQSTGNVVSTASEGSTTFDDRIFRQALQTLDERFDPVYGGFGPAPKFPHPMDLKLLLRAWRRFDSSKALEMTKKTLDCMAWGGMYDQLGGGFHRYSTDNRWLAPHFEKMLYDNALLVSAYLEAYQATRDPFYSQIVEETLGYVLREMTSPEGAFYSTQDADSEGEEGKFFVWSKQEVEQILDKELAEIVCAVYDVSDGGNWEGKNILNRSRRDEADAKQLGLDVADFRSKLSEARQKLFDVRSQRVWPARDEKILTAWNGLMIGAFAEAAQVLDSPEYERYAKGAAGFVLETMRRDDGRLYRTCGAGSDPKLNGYLEDYAFVLDALVTLYETTFDLQWIEEAASLARVMIEQFWDDKDGAFYFTGRDHEELIARNKDMQDGAVPSGNSMAATALLRLGKLTGESLFLETAERTLHAFHGIMQQHPAACAQMFLALVFLMGPLDEFAVVGDIYADDTNVALRSLR
ncbi:MAG: thioredoxin domain-containing protein, partial [Gemmataceae bacterium]